MGLKQNNSRLIGLLVPSKPWEWRTAFGAKCLHVLREASDTLHNKYKDPNFIFVTQFAPQNKAHNIS